MVPRIFRNLPNLEELDWNSCGKYCRDASCKGAGIDTSEKVAMPSTLSFFDAGLRRHLPYAVDNHPLRHLRKWIASPQPLQTLYEYVNTHTSVFSGLQSIHLVYSHSPYPEVAATICDLLGVMEYNIKQCRAICIELDPPMPDQNPVWYLSNLQVSSTTRLCAFRPNLSRVLGCRRPVH